MAKTAAPTGLSVKRTDQAFTCTWKIPSGGYGDGQEFQYATSFGGWKSINPKIGKTTTAKMIPLYRADFYPTSGKDKTISFAFRVRGNASASKGVDPTMSDWATCRFDIKVPNKPTVTTTVGTYPKTTFTWKVAVKDNDAYYFTRVLYDSILVKDSNETDGAKAFKLRNVGTRYNNTNGSANSSIAITEDSGQLADGHSYTRWFKICSQGTAGNSAWVYAKHVYALPNQCTITKYEAKENADAQGYNVKVWFNSPYSASRPIGKTTVEYAYAVPDEGMTCPDGASWQEGSPAVIKDTTSGVVFSTDSLLNSDQCLFVRVNATYDGRTTYGVPKVIDVGSLSAPTGLSVSADSATYKATVTATNASAVEDSYLVVKYITADDPNGIDIGIIPHGKTSAIVQCPAWETTPTFGVYAAVGSYIVNADYVLSTDSTVTVGKIYYKLQDGQYIQVAPTGNENPATQGWYETTGVVRYDVNADMVSPVVTYGGTVPTAPKISAYPTQPSGTIRVTWDWSWNAADSAEISWADHADAWESTAQPQTFIVSKMRASAWNISDLETGKTWYVRVRLIQGDESEGTFGAYSTTAVVNLASAPLVPVMQLSDAIITESGQVTASWVYSTTDGTAQAFAKIAEVTLNEESDAEDEYIYTDLIDVQTAQYATLYAADYGWQAGEAHDLVVKVVSASGRESDGWSDPVTVYIADPLECTITATSLTSGTITSTDESGDPASITVSALTALPLTVTVTGAGDSGISTLSIERAESYHVARPDETEFNGFEGETIYTQSMYGEGTFTVGLDDLIGKLDDGATYRIVATVQDAIGQSATADKLKLANTTEVDNTDFTVLWSHQPTAPTATVTVDHSDMTAVIEATAPSGAALTDVCDVYRLSADKPEKILEGAAFGETYIDPYPTIGIYGGYRFVTRTATGDYISGNTANGNFAWVDVFDALNTRYNVIDFGSGRALLEYDFNTSSSWKKDFQETKYLGGSIQGDWNKPVSRTATVSFTAVAGKDADLIETMRRLASYAGVCHVRTKEGSSYPADVEVSETYNSTIGVKTYDYSLSITRVDQQELDGMTVDQWQDLHEESE